jgi:alkylation response protein AidB-like acyl-CoA dehydrogenase
MDFTYPPEAEAFRAEFRAWLDEHLTEEFRGLRFWGEPDEHQLDRARRWNHLLADAGYAAISWPARFGGRDASVMEQVVFAEECTAAGAAGPINVIGISNIAPAIMTFGTPDQQDRFLRPMLRGDEIWCQGFSEPNAGSDLASLSTQARWVGDRWIVNGQKVWNTLGQLASWCELLVRTDPDAPRHRGISALLVAMDSPGIEVRPLRTPTGTAEFHEIFFTDVEVPADALLGKENDGWTVAMATLGFERGGVASLHLQVRRRIAELIDATQTAGLGSDPVARQRLAELWIAGERLRHLANRAISAAAQGLPPGPESSLVKLLWSTVSQQVAQTAVDLLGLDATRPGSPWHEPFVSSPSLTIAGGTSEVNKNIIGERVLGLPR